ncbi:hypothetical protein BRAS3843_1390023 [Bradyrhizobium sp. STM 3843]|nr:hypothetical protein BRAS3843_1390023 [Bradyrhizobium sp. STM 3843]
MLFWVSAIYSPAEMLTHLRLIICNNSPRNASYWDVRKWPVADLSSERRDVRFREMTRPRHVAC